MTKLHGGLQLTHKYTLCSRLVCVTLSVLTRCLRTFFYKRLWCRAAMSTKDIDFLEVRKSPHLRS